MFKFVNSNQNVLLSHEVDSKGNLKFIQQQEWDTSKNFLESATAKVHDNVVYLTGVDSGGYDWIEIPLSPDGELALLQLLLDRRTQRIEEDLGYNKQP